MKNALNCAEPGITYINRNTTNLGQQHGSVCTEKLVFTAMLQVMTIIFGYWFGKLRQELTCFSESCPLMIACKFQLS